MNLVVSYCHMKYYSFFNPENLLRQIREEIDPTISAISHEMQYVLNKITASDPCSFLDVAVCKQVLSLLEGLHTGCASSLKVDDTIFEYFLVGLNSYYQLSEIMGDLSSFNISEEIKTRLYRLPTYATILESCLSNFLRVIVNLTGQAVGKDYAPQNTLGKLLTVIESNGYTEVLKNVNTNLRNAINHGKVSIEKEATGNILCFYFVENHVEQCVRLRTYEFDRELNSAYDTVSGLLMGLSIFINNHIDILDMDKTSRKYVSFSLLSMEISLPGVFCRSISDTGNSKQLNIEIEIEDTDRTYIGQVATLLLILIYERYNGYEQYMLSFSNPRMITGWVRYKNQEISDMYNKRIGFDAALKSVVERGDFIIFGPPAEDVDLNEVKYFIFPNRATSRYKINNVNDASLEDRKRLKAHLYIGEVPTRDEILEIISEAIDWLKNVKNPPSPVKYHKYGSVEADALYINVYRRDLRKSKELLPSNDNFVCFVDYNLSGETTLQRGGLPESVWNRFHHEVVGNLTIAWREGRYFTR